MVLLVDAFNVLYKFPVLEEHMAKGRLAEARVGLLEILFAFTNKLGKPLEFHLYFDGKKMKGDFTQYEVVSGMHVYFSHDLSADHLIRKRIREAERPADFRVVSSDKQIMGHAKKYKSQVQTSEDFAKWVTAVLNDEGVTPEKDENVTLSPKDLNYWMKEFSKKPRPK